MQPFTHLLQTHGVLKNFNIVHKLLPSELKKLRDEVRQKSKNKKEYEANMVKHMKALGVEKMRLSKLPGIMVNGKPLPEESDVEDRLDRQKLLVEFAKILSKQIKINDFSQQEQGFLVVSLSKILGLRLSDFREWQDDNIEKPGLED
jgi:hypothetical protein